MNRGETTRERMAKEGRTAKEDRIAQLTNGWGESAGWTALSGTLPEPVRVPGDLEAIVQRLEATTVAARDAAARAATLTHRVFGSDAGVTVEQPSGKSAGSDGQVHQIHARITALNDALADVWAQLDRLASL
jgi:hypothetical protein